MANFIRVRLRLPGGPAVDASPDAHRAAWPLRPFSFLLSLCAHAGVFWALVDLPPASGRPIVTVHAALYQMIPLTKNRLIPRPPSLPPLPAVSPLASLGARRTFHGRERSQSEQIVVQRAAADSGRQWVWRPDKPESLPAETPLPNRVMLKGMAVPNPLPPPPGGANTTSAPEPAPAPANARPEPKAFVLPADKASLPIPSGLVADAPPDLTTPPVGLAGAVVGTGALPRRPAPFVLPPSRNSGPGTSNAGEGELAAPPSISTGGTGSTVTAAVIGLDPAGTWTALPDGSRPAAFSRAAKQGDPSGGTPGQGPLIPGVAVSGGAHSTTMPAATSAPFFTLRIPAAATTLSAPLRPSARTLPRAIEARFPGRIVYVLVVPKPNLPDYIADWTIWFSQRHSDAPAPTSVRAPVPIRKTLRPQNPGGGLAAGGWVQIAAVIGKDGSIGEITPMPGHLPAVAQKAAEDLAQWQFRPATRNGEAVDVDVVIEVPFRVR